MRPASPERLVDALAEDLRPVRPLATPAKRALGWLALVTLIALPVTYVFGDPRHLVSRYSGRESLLVLEILAMLATGILATVAAFAASVPGRSTRWRLAPVAPFAVWLLLSGAGCIDDLANPSTSGWALSLHCLRFILVTSAALALPLVWALSRARPIDALPVAVLGGLASAAISALLLQFFHPFAVTILDLSVHVATIALVVGISALFRRTLRPA